MIDLGHYHTFVFDCDGVILNSNKIKTAAFYDVTSRYGAKAACALVEFHVKNGGVSRFVKFKHLFQEILNRDYSENEYQSLLDDFSARVSSALINCEIAKGLDQLRALHPQSRWLVASGGDQEELRHVFKCRGIDKYFNGGIYGSPSRKLEIVEREVGLPSPEAKVVLLGDSQLDYEVANTLGIDFIFVSGWSEFSDHETFFYNKSIQKIEFLFDLID